jgi:glycerate-2-kinase
MVEESPAMDGRAFLLDLFDAALAAAGPEGRFGPLPEVPAGRTLVLGAGKAAARMAAAFEDAWEAHAGAPPEGLVVTRYGHGAPTRSVEVAEAAHPVPDAAGEAAGRRVLEMARAAGPRDLVVFLVSGGASALLAVPAAISEMNRVRQALSAVKGGRLAAAAAPARVVTYAISDVPGDDPAVIGSGPTVPAPPGEAAEAILARRGVSLPGTLADAMAANPTPAPGPEPADFRLVAAPQQALEAAAEAARILGVEPLILGDSIEGEAREVARVMAGIAAQVARHGQPARRPCVLLSGGETTVTVRGRGRGGRNAEFLLALALALGPLAAAEGLHALAADSDGIDGVERNAGAVIGPDSLARMRAAGLDPRALLEDNDAFAAFEPLGDLVETGPTLTNVNDFRAVLIA